MKNKKINFNYIIGFCYLGVVLLAVIVLSYRAIQQRSHTNITAPSNEIVVEQQSYEPENAIHPEMATLMAGMPDLGGHLQAAWQSAAIPQDLE